MGRYDSDAMPKNRRARPTLRCLSEDLGLSVPALDVDLGELGHPWMDELRRTAPTAPLGQKRVLSIDRPLIYRLRSSSHRAATWIDEEIWCALSARSARGTRVRGELRDILFAALEAYFPDAIFEVRADWPTGQAEWWETVTLGLR
jgi:hypothetical protein